MIVGAGLAGLSCAYRLNSAASPARSTRPTPSGSAAAAGPRATGRRARRPSTAASSSTRATGGCARWRSGFGLELTDLYAVPNPGTPRLWLNGELRRRSELSAERRLFQRRIEREARRVGAYWAPTTPRAAVAFDQLSVNDWLDRNLPAGSAGLWGQYVWAEMASEFGLDADRLSALNLFYEYVEATPGADERYHVSGGNDQILGGARGRAARGTINLDAPLEALFERADGSYGLRFGGSADEVVADQVVLAIPFTTLRRVDLAGAGLSAKRRRCIDDLGMGTNAKVLTQFDRRPRDYGGWNGYMYNDDPFLATWESTLGEPGRQSIITTYFGGRSGAGGLSPTKPTRRRSARAEAHLRQPHPGRTDGPRRPCGRLQWPRLDRSLGLRPVGARLLRRVPPRPVHALLRLRRQPEGAIHFAGEHTATDNQGYLEGAVESGERCAGRSWRLSC